MPLPKTSVIKERSVVEDEWNLLRLAEGETPEQMVVTDTNLIVPLTVWQTQTALHTRKDVGIWLASHERPEVLKGFVNDFPIIAVDFPKFADGRGYSIAFNLRQRLGYCGELRAIGDVLRDQIFYMQRVGFTSFLPRADQNPHEVLKGLNDFSERYQAAWDEKLPLFRRRDKAPV